MSVTGADSSIEVMLLSMVFLYTAETSIPRSMVVILEALLQ